MAPQRDDPDSDSLFDARLLRACKLGMGDLAVSALLSGADPNARDSEGFTGLMAAARLGHASIVSTISFHQVDLEACDPEHGRTALLWAAREGRSSCAKALLDAGAYPCSAGLDGLNAAMLAAREGHNACLILAIEAGADIHATTLGCKAPGEAMEGDEGDDCNDALGFAAFHGHARCAEILLQAGADPNRLYPQGRTAALTPPPKDTTTF